MRRIWGIWGDFEAFSGEYEPFWRNLGHFRGIFRHFEGILGRSGGSGAFWGLFKNFGVFRVHFGGIWGSFWGALRHFGAHSRAF